MKKEERETCLGGKAHSLPNLLCCHLPHVERASHDWITKSASTGNFFFLPYTCVCAKINLFFVIGQESKVIDSEEAPVERRSKGFKIQAQETREVRHTGRTQPQVFFVCLCMGGTISLHL